MEKLVMLLLLATVVGCEKGEEKITAKDRKRLEQLIEETIVLEGRKARQVRVNK